MNTFGRRVTPSLLLQVPRLTAMAVLLFALAVLAPANLIGLIERDYTGNTTATNKLWFYRQLDGTAKPDGYGIFPYIEWKGHTHPFNVPGVVYVKGGGMTLKLTWTNPQLAALEGDLTVLGLRLRLPPAIPGQSATYVQLSASGAMHLQLPAEGGQDSVTLSITGIPAYVCRGVIELDAKVVGTDVLWNTGGYMSIEELFVTDSTSTGDQSEPWLEVLAMGRRPVRRPYKWIPGPASVD